METPYVPPPHINRTLAMHTSLDETFTLTCSVTVDSWVTVDLSWTTPNAKAMSQGRLDAPAQITDPNPTNGGTQQKIVKQVRVTTYML